MLPYPMRVVRAQSVMISVPQNGTSVPQKREMHRHSWNMLMCAVMGADAIGTAMKRHTGICVQQRTAIRKHR